MPGTSSPTRQKSSLASRVFCLHFFSYLLASPSDWKCRFPTFHLIFGCCKMTLCCSTCSDFPCHDCFSGLKKISQPWGSFLQREAFTEEQVYADLLLSMGGDFLILQQLSVPSENHVFSYVSWLEKEQFDCLWIPWKYSELSKHLSLSNSYYGRGEVEPFVLILLHKGKFSYISQVIPCSVCLI